MGQAWERFHRRHAQLQALQQPLKIANGRPQPRPQRHLGLPAQLFPRQADVRLALAGIILGQGRMHQRGA